jgi:hypothetical protein
MRALRAFDRWWWIGALAVGAILAYLNRDALGMQGVYPDYLCFRAAIVAGMDPAANHCASPTFPMWGYGWLLAVTTGKYVLLLFQIALAVGAAWIFLRVLQETAVMSRRAARLAKAALLVSVPWYAANALRWPYSEAASLLLAAVAVLVLALVRGGRDYRLFAASGILLGVALNFRSDYIALPVLAAVVLLALGSQRSALAARVAVWLAAIVVALVPWMVYSARATGHVLATSTNGGHVLFIGLGQLPGNPWGITPFDSDPRMRRELDAHFGHTVSSLTYASDTFLRDRFLHLVREHPAAWLHKDARNAGHTFVDGFYDGEFIQQTSCGARCWVRYGYSADGTNAVRSRLTTLFGSSGLSAGERIRFALVQLGIYEGKLVSLLGFLAAVVVFVLALRRRLLPLALVALVPVYVLLLNAFVYELPSYSSNAYVFLVVLLAVAAARAARAFTRWTSVGAGSGSGSGSGGG